MAYPFNAAGLPVSPKINFNNVPRERGVLDPVADAIAKRDAQQRAWEAKNGKAAGHFPGYSASPQPDWSGARQNSGTPLALSVDDGFAPTSATPANPMPFAAFGQQPQQAPQAVNVINSGFAPRPASTPASALPKRPQSQPDRFAVNNNPAQRSIEARPVDINYMGIDPYALKQEQITESFWGGTPQVKDGSTDYMGGLINYNPKEGQTGADRMGLFGGAMQDAAAWLDGDGSSADHLSKAQARSEATRKEANTNSARERAQQMLSAAGDDVEAQREALMYGAMKGVDLSDYAAALKYGQPEYKEGDPGKDLYRVDANGRRTLVRSGISEPKISGGVQWTRENGYQKVPFWLEQQTAIARARGAARNGAGSIGVPGLGDGWAMD